jgi:hypothetical protein
MLSSLHFQATDFTITLLQILCVLHPMQIFSQLYLPRNLHEKHVSALFKIFTAMQLKIFFIWHRIDWQLITNRQGVISPNEIQYSNFVCLYSFNYNIKIGNKLKNITYSLMKVTNILKSSWIMLVLYMF